MSQIIEKLPNGKYKVRVWHTAQNGERFSKQQSNIKSMALAKQTALLFEENLMEQNDYTDLTFSRLFALYCDSSRYRRMSPSSQNFIERTKDLVLNKIGKYKANELNTPKIQKFIDTLANEPNSRTKGGCLSASTLKKYYGLIQAVVNWGVSMSYVEYNRIKRVEFPNDTEYFEPTILDVNIIADILTFMKARYYPLYIPTLLAVTMSLRRGEVLGLRWQDVDFERGVAKLVKNVIQVDNVLIERDKLKSRSSHRYVVLSDSVKQELLEHKAMNELLDDNHVCANVFSDFPTPSFITHAFHDVLLRYFNIKIRFHDLRHNFNQMAYESDIDDVTRAKIMGHSNASVTNNIYTHFSTTKAKVAVEAVSQKIINKQ